jgi:hypothetical protein
MATTGYNKVFYGFLLFAPIQSTVAWAQNLEDIQRQFNEETISKPFIVPDDASLTASLKAATERGTPTKSPGYVVPNMPLLGGYGYGGYGYGGYVRPYYGGLYGGGYSPFYGGWW